MSSQKLAPPRGTHDLFGDEERCHSYIIQTAKKLAANYQFLPLETPIFEKSEVFLRTLGEASDIVNKEMYTFEDKGGESLTLRPEGTAPVVRAVISHGWAREAPLKFFYAGPMFRYERPQKGRLRQFHQFGVELIGGAEVLAEVEVISLAYQILQTLSAQNINLEINSLGDKESRIKYKEALIKHFEKCPLSENSKRRLQTNPLRILDSKDEQDLPYIQEAPQINNYLNESSKKLFENICSELSRLNWKYQINPRLVRGLDYYSHCVFEFTSQDLGAQNAVLSGGRYDHLVHQMGGPNLPGMGFAAGVERLALLLKVKPTLHPIVSLIPIGKEAEKKAFSLAIEWRQKGYSIDLAFSGNLSKRMKKAHKAKASYALIMGEEEMKSSTFQLKNLQTGEQKKLSAKETENFLKVFFSGP